LAVAPTPSEPLDGEDEDTEVRITPAPPARTNDTLRTPIADQPGAPDVDLAPGTVLGEYRVGDKIGEGGMGLVYAASHPVIGKRAAIKVLRRTLCENPVTLERFIDEARVVNQIGHPNIVDVFAFGTLPDGRSYFVMEWLQGESLRARLARGRLGIGEACSVLRTLARALAAAHEKGVIHRDLKPENVFLVEDRDAMPRIKLLDFGIAKLMREDSQVVRTATGAMIGTPQYVAPEQAKGRAIDPSVDLYSLGCIAYELFTGRTPFLADNAMEMVAKHLMEVPPRPRKLDSSVPPEVDSLIFAMLAKDSVDRPTLTEVGNVFDRVARRVSAELHSARGTASTRVYGVEWPPRPLVIGLALAGAVVMAVIAYLLVNALAPVEHRPPRPPAVTPSPAPVLPVEPGANAARSR
jgi:serine/threonine-protein kinase